MPRAAAVIPAVAVAALAVAGCGDKGSGGAAPAATTTPASGVRVTSFARVEFPNAGVSFDRPRGWKYATGAAPLLGTISSGEVTIAIWRYPRKGALPESLAELTEAKDILLKAARARDPSLKVIKAKGTRAAHHPAVVIVARETVAGDPRTVRSTHVYADGGEVVVDAFAPPSVFPKVEDPVFRKVVRSLRVVAPSGG